VVGRHVVLAAGSVPRTLPGLDVDGRFVLTSDDSWTSTGYPPRGGCRWGAIGCEFASLLSDLGTKVTVIEALTPSWLAVTRHAAVVARSFRKRGIEVITGTG